MEALAVIEAARARKVFDSRGSPTIEIEIETATGVGRCSAPAGASRGVHEAVAFPSGGVDEAIKLFEEEVAPKLVGLDAADQKSIDETLKEIDGTPNFSRIGGSTAIASSIAAAKAAASSLGLPLYRWIGGAMANSLPIPLGNVLGGGKHAAAKALDIQEILVFPLNARSVKEAIAINAEIHRRLPKRIAEVDDTFAGGKTDEGAWVARLNAVQALKIVREVCDEVGDEYGCKVGLGIDMAASSLWAPSKNLYVYAGEGVERTPEEHLDFVLGLIEDYNLLYVEDPLHEEDFEGFAELTRKVKNCLICGDDLFTTNPSRLRRGVEMSAARAIIIKPNQIGTLSASYETASLARSSGMVIVVSHRSGETEDEALAHIAVGFSAHLIKTGVVGGERIAKLNELIRIEEELPSATMSTLPVS
ncbi:MAG: phosphopyruvate hydratase [Thermoprotei archaeon]|nr:MAG: phosphopyruvate hydratase [Thermoprotei archaeon]